MKHSRATIISNHIFVPVSSYENEVDIYWSGSSLKFERICKFKEYSDWLKQWLAEFQYYNKFKFMLKYFIVVKTSCSRLDTSWWSRQKFWDILEIEENTMLDLKSNTIHIRVQYTYSLLFNIGVRYTYLLLFIVPWKDHWYFIYIDKEILKTSCFRYVDQNKFFFLWAKVTLFAAYGSSSSALSRNLF